MKLFKKLFEKPTFTEFASRELEHHQRMLLIARQHQQSTAATVIYHERVIADLKRTIGEQ